MVAEWEDGVQTDFLPELYLAGTAELQATLEGISAEVDILLALGHNPGWENAVHQFTGTSIIMPTAAAALLQVEAEDWAECAYGRWKLVDVILPRRLDD